MESLQVAVRAALDGRQAQTWTAMPGILQSFDAEAVTASVQIAIQAQVRQPDGTWLDTTISVCADCPVVFGGGGGCVGTFPLDQGDEGLLVFASRCIDAWWQSGGVQKQAELRMHDLSDGFFIPGCFSQPRAANITGGVSTSEAQLRSLDGTVMARVNPTTKQAGLIASQVSLVVDGQSGKCEIAAPAGLWVNGVQVTVP